MGLSAPTPDGVGRGIDMHSFEPFQPRFVVPTIAIIELLDSMSLQGFDAAGWHRDDATTLFMQ